MFLAHPAFHRASEDRTYGSSSSDDLCVHVCHFYVLHIGTVTGIMLHRSPLKLYWNGLYVTINVV